MMQAFHQTKRKNNQKHNETKQNIKYAYFLFSLKMTDAKVFFSSFHFCVILNT